MPGLIEQIKSEAKLSQFIESRNPDANLRSTGNGVYRGRCPIHGGARGDSLLVNDEDGFFYCHACGEGGDIVEWVEQTQSLETQDAVRELAREYNIEVSDKAPVDIPKSCTAKRVIEKVVDIWHDALPVEVRQFARDHYGWTDTTIDRLRIGWSKEGWGDNAGFSLEECLSSGLVILDKNEKPRVPLRRRLTLPWFVDGKPAYVSGRAVDVGKHKTPSFGRGQEPHKYVQQSVHSSAREYVDESVGKPLWGQDELRSADNVVVAEGMPDVISAWQHISELDGRWAAVSSGSCKFDKPAMDLMLRRAPNATYYIAFDTDEEGINGALEVGGLLAKRGKTVYVVNLLDFEGDDLNEALRAGEPLPAMLDSAKTIAEFWALRLRHEAGKDRVPLFEDKIVPLIAQLRDEAREAAIGVIAEALSLTIGQVEQAVKDFDVAEAGDTEGVLGQVLELFGDYYAVIGHRREGGSTDLVVWSKKHGDMIDLPLISMNKIPGLIAPEVNIYEAIQEETDSSYKESKYLFQRAMHYLATESSPVGKYKKLKSGLHAVDDKVVIVSGNRIIVREEGSWERVYSPFIDREHVVECSSVSDDWLEFTVDELNAPFKEFHQPKDVFRILEMIVSECWKLRFENDAAIIAALAFSMTWSSAFPRKSLVHIRGPAGCGKTTLNFGLLGGGPSYARMGGPFIPTARCEEDVSQAGVTSRYSHSGHTLLLDEAELKANPQTRRERNTLEVLSILRNAAESGTEVLRGTAEGGWRTATMDIGCIVSSINPWEDDADIRRWLVIEPRRDDDVKPPVSTVSHMIDEFGLDRKEMRRAVLLAFQDQVEDLDRWYEHMSKHSIPGDENISPSQRDNALPILTSLKLLSDNFNIISRQFFEDKEVYEQAAMQHKIENRLMDRLLNSRIEFPGYEETTVGTRLSELSYANTDAMAIRGIALDDLTVGLADDPDNVQERQVLYVNFNNAVESGPLADTEFSQVSGRKMASIAESHRAFIKSGKRKRFGGVQVRWTMFDWSILQEGVLGVDE